MDGSAALTGRLAGMVIGPMLRFIGASLVAIASFALVMAWHNAPQRVIDAQRAERFTGHKDARIVESWVTLAFDPSEMASSQYWRGFATWRPCVVVEYDADWGAARRGFCGPRYGFIPSTRVHDLREVSPGVPFDFSRDVNGFRVPQLRMSQAAWDYLAGHPAINTSRKITALEELRQDLDRPVDAAIVSWTSPPPSFALAFDPQRPDELLPAGLMAARSHADIEWLPGIVATVVGLAFWWVGMNVLLFNMPFVARLLLTVLPLLALPWWAQELPNALRHFNRDVAATVRETLGDITTAGSMEAGEPAAMPLHDGRPLLLGAADGAYADTIGRFRFPPPASPIATADAALAALIDATTRQVRTLGESERVELFGRLRRDKVNRRPHAGLVFVRSARESLLDPRSPPQLQAAARNFLSEWVVTPVLTPLPGDPAFEQKLAAWRELLDIPVTEIAYSASLFIEDAEKAARRKR